MSDVGNYLWLIPGLPLLASAVTAFLGPRFLRQHSHWPGILPTVASCVLSFFVLSAVSQLEPLHAHEAGAASAEDHDHAPADRRPGHIERYYDWADRKS